MGPGQHQLCWANLAHSWGNEECSSIDRSTRECMQLLYIPNRSVKTHCLTRAHCKELQPRKKPPIYFNHKVSSALLSLADFRIAGVYNLSQPAFECFLRPACRRKGVLRSSGLHNIKSPPYQFQGIQIALKFARMSHISLLKCDTNKMAYVI